MASKTLREGSLIRYNNLFYKVDRINYKDKLIYCKDLILKCEIQIPFDAKIEIK